MTVTEAVTASGITPSADYKGIENTDDFVLAICTEASKKDAVKDWTVCADHVREHSGALNASTSDNTYIRTGPVTTKGSVQRTLAINGDRRKGDAFQDFILGHEMIMVSARASSCPTSISPCAPARARWVRPHSSSPATWAALPAQSPPLPAM